MYIHYMCLNSWGNPHPTHPPTPIIQCRMIYFQLHVDHAFDGLHRNICQLSNHTELKTKNDFAPLCSTLLFWYGGGRGTIKWYYDQIFTPCYFESIT